MSGEWGSVVALDFIVDRIAPWIASVEVFYPSGQTAARNSQQIRVTAMLYEETTLVDPDSVLLRSADVDSNSAVGYVMVDDGTGEDAVDGDGIYTGVLTVTSDSTGSFSFTIEASDIVPNKRVLTGQIILDNIAPNLSIQLLTVPVNNEVYEDEVLIKGSYYDLPDSGNVSRLELDIRNFNGDHINNSPIHIPVDEDRKFSLIIRLVNGENHITVTVEDYSGNSTTEDTVLIYVPPTETEYVDQSGGTMRSPDGTSIDIPSSAILNGETIYIRTVSTDAFPDPMDSIALLEKAHEFGPDGLIFHRPVQISLVYNESDLDINQDGQNDFNEDELQVFYLDENNWIQITSTARDIDNNTVTFTTNHFSVYALGNAEAAEELSMYWTHNPFKSEEGTTAVVELDQEGEITLKIYDLSGNLVRTIMEREAVTGSSNWRWDGMNDFDQYVGSGLYIYIFEYAKPSGSKQVLKKPIGVIR